MKEKKFGVKDLTTAGLIAALYVILTLFAQMLGLASGVIQLRISEALTILPIFTAAAVPGLAIGCLLFNISFAGALPLDFLVGTLASGLAAGSMWLTRKVTIKNYPLLGLFMPAIFNAFLVGWELTAYIGGAFWLNALYVAIGEAAVLLTLGTGLFYMIKGRRLEQRLFR